jgi:DtxR family Mn-dependent transcriptional regulator
MKEKYLFSRQEENYLKVLLELSGEGRDKGVGINELAREMGLRPPTVHQMLGKFKKKKWVRFERYGKIYLTKEGTRISLAIVRRHRIWEAFLHDVLKFSWEEVHELAEYLEHIPSDKLIDRLEEFLGYPAFDPHGEPIPDRKGKTRKSFRKSLSMGNTGNTYQIAAVNDRLPALLQFMSQQGIKKGDRILFISKQNLDEMAEIGFSGKKITVGKTFMDNVMVLCENCLKGKKCLDDISCK